MFEEDHVAYRYKYLPFNEGSIKTITEGTIKFTCPLDFNDPFDCMPYYDPNRVDNYLKNNPHMIDSILDNMNLSPAKKITKRREHIEKVRNKYKDGSIGKEIIKRVGVLSLSKDALNILMWSHYANYHKGIVLEFRIPFHGKKSEEKRIHELLVPFPVRYSNERPIYKMDEDQENILNKILLTKSEVWDYEQEERVLDYKRKAGIYEYARDEILASIIAGIKMSDIDYKILEKHVNKIKIRSLKGLKLYRAKEVEKEYRLTVPGHPRLVT